MGSCFHDQMLSDVSWSIVINRGMNSIRIMIHTLAYHFYPCLLLQRAFFPGVSGGVPPPLPKMEPLPVLDQVARAQGFPVSRMVACYKSSVHSDPNRSWLVGLGV